MVYHRSGKKDFSLCIKAFFRFGIEWLVSNRQFKAVWHTGMIIPHVLCNSQCVRQEQSVHLGGAVA